MKGEKVYRRGEDDDKCSITTGGYIVKTLEALIWQWEKEKDEEEEFLYNKAAYNKMNKGCRKSNKAMPHN